MAALSTVSGEHAPRIRSNPVADIVTALTADSRAMPSVPRLRKATV
jgi:hypothetical protein